MTQACPEGAVAAARPHLSAPRPALLAVLVVLAVLGAAPAPAQAQNLFGDLLKRALGAGSGQCRTLLEWVRTPAPATPAEVAPADPRQRRAPQPMAVAGVDVRMLHLVNDEVFSKHFGKKYEQLTLQDFRSFQQDTQRACMQGGEFTPAEWQTVQQLWNQHTHAYVVRAAQQRRAQLEAAERERASARAEFDAVLAEVTQADAQQLTLQRLQALRERGRALAARAGAEATPAFDAAYLKTAQALVPPLLRQRVQEAITEAQAPEHLPLLARAREAVAAQGSALGVALPADDAVWLSLQRRERELALAAAEAERRELAGFADGLGGLEAGVQWQRRFQSRWGGGAGAVPELTAVQADFRQRRDAVLARSGPGLLQAVDAATTVAEAQGLVARYTLPAEAQQPAVAAMREAVDARIRLIERNQALGRVTAAGPAQPVQAGAALAAAPAATTTAAPAQANRRPAADTGEPSEEVMYELVRQRFENAAKRVQQMYGQCQGGGDRSNPVNALMCLGLNMQRGATGGALGTPTRIQKFAKVGCRESPAYVGWNCEYEIDTDSAMDQQFLKLTGFQIDQSGYGRNRFVRNREGVWLMITEGGGGR